MIWIIAIAAGYILLDFVFGMVFGRCILPGLKCKACKWHSKSTRSTTVVQGDLEV